MKRPILFDELFLWLRGRFSMTREEKGWMLLILVIAWVGLIGRYTYLKNQSAEVLPPQEVEELTLHQ
jgi:hypothetical protein